MAKASKSRKTAALVLSAGAPHSPLMAGALCAIWEANKTFTIIYTAGAGGLVGMLFAAPRDYDPPTALRRMVDLGVDDAIYRYFPVGYKAFFKAGPFTQLFRYWAKLFHLPPYGHHHWPHGGWPGHYPMPPIPIPVPHPSPPMPTPGPVPWPLPWPPHGGGWGHHHHHHHHHPWPDTHHWWRLYNDWIDFWFSAWTPSAVTYASQGLCEPLPFLEEMVDFTALQHFPGDFYLNAYNINRHEMKNFSKEILTAQHFRAALAAPFIYPPVEVDGELYYEGADRDPIPQDNFFKLKGIKQTDTIVIVDILGSLETSLIRPPRNIWDAYVLSIVTPIVSLAKKSLESFREEVSRQLSKRAIILEFTIPPAQAPYILDWSRSNMSALWDIGYQTGKAFIDDFGDQLPDRPRPDRPT